MRKLQTKLLFSLWSVVCLLFCIGHTETIKAESYTLSVGESVTISQKTYAGGYISNCGLADYLDPHLEWTKNADMSCTITVKSYFDYTATVKLVFLETYSKIYGGRGIYTTYKDVTINCKYQKPDPSKKPTKVILPERVQIPVGTNVYVTPTLEPSGAQWTSRSWEKISGDGFRVSNVQNELRGYIYGRSIGRGKAMITVDDNLRDTMIVEVIDPDNPPPKGMLLPNNVEVSVGGHATLNPVLSPENAITSYTWESNDKTIATVSNGKVVGIKPGTATITVTSANELTATCTVTVVASGGKDDEPEDTTVYTGVIDGHGYVDLGLSVKWAAYDVGSDSILASGDHYAWGETETKSSYDIKNYSYGHSIGDMVYIGNDISGTKYDVAHVKWGDNWRMPTRSEASEFVQKCTFKACTINGKYGFLVTGPNGNTLFLPGMGNGSTDVIYSNYWTSAIYKPSNDTGWDYVAYEIRIREFTDATITQHNRWLGNRVRPVCPIAKLSSNKEPISITLPQTKTMTVYDEDEISYTISPVNATSTLKWKSSDESIASVSQMGIVTAKKKGTATISLSSQNGITAECQVTVKDIETTAMEIEQKSITVSTGYQFVLNYATTPQDATSAITWSSSNPAIATVEETTGIITALSTGQCTIRGISDTGISMSCDMIVVAASPVKKIAAGHWHSLVLKQDGSLWGCGSSGWGQLGYLQLKNHRSSLGNPKGPISKIDDGVVDIFCGNANTFYLKENGTLWGMGNNENQKLGVSSGNQYYLSTPTKIMDNVASVSSSESHTLILKQDGTLWACGENDEGELGDGTTEKKDSPVKIADNVKTMSAGYETSYFIKQDGTLWSCGYNYWGQLGDGTTTNRTKPVKIADNVKNIAGGWVYAAYVKQDGTLWTFGHNNYGQLGNGSTEDSTTPIKVADKVSSIIEANFSYLGCIVFKKEDNTLWGVGQGGSWINDKIGTKVTTPNKIADDVMSAAVGDGFTLIIKNDGSVWGCGISENGEFPFSLSDTLTTPSMLYKYTASPIAINTSDAGYATFYSSESAYILPTGLSASVVTGCSNNKLTYRSINGSTIPSGVAVMLTASNKSAATYTLNPADNGDAYTGTNLLHGSDGATTTSGDGLHYKLSYGPSSNSSLKNVFGWYWGASNGGAFQIDAHKAWLVVPSSAAKGTRAFTIYGEATGIETIGVNKNDDVYYDLQGRKISKPNRKGVYIKNGKKYINL